MGGPSFCSSVRSSVIVLLMNFDAAIIINIFPGTLSRIRYWRKELWTALVFFKKVLLGLKVVNPHSLPAVQDAGGTRRGHTTMWWHQMAQLPLWIFHGDHLKKIAKTQWCLSCLQPKRFGILESIHCDLLNEFACSWQAGTCWLRHESRNCGTPGTWHLQRR